MKIFLTGQKQIGKSTCIGTFLEKSQTQACGFQTLPVYENGKRIGFCIHALVEMEDNDRRFSIQHDTYNEVIPGVFDSFGCQVLEKSMEYPSRILILDEIGVLEREEAAYLELLKRAVHTHEQVLGVLKKKEAAHNAWMWKDPELKILDLDEISFEKALDILCRSFTPQDGRMRE